MGNFYHQEMSKEEYDSKFDQIVWNVKGVHTMEELSRLLEKELRREWKYFDLPLWRMVVIDDYSADKSYCIYLFNHGLSDGI